MILQSSQLFISLGSSICFCSLPLGASLFPTGQMIFLMQYSERMPYGPTSLRFMISVVVMFVSVVSAAAIKTHTVIVEDSHRLLHFYEHRKGENVNVL